MILEELTLRNWRSYRDPHTFHFEEGFNLVVGRNEGGKSTLFEAMTRVFFDRHNSRTEEIRRIQPLGSSLSPEAEIIFQADGTRYRVVKRFIDHPVSQLFSERGGAWELDHEGDRADSELRNLLQGQAAGRATRAEHRGIAQALWYLQFEQPLPEKEWAESIKQGLAGLVQYVASSPDEGRVLDAIEEVYSTDFTRTGRIAAKSELTGLEAEIEKEESQLEELRSRLEHLEALRSNLEELTTRNTEGVSTLNQAQVDLAQLAVDLEAADAIEEQIRLGKDAVRISGERLKVLSESQNNIDRRAKEIIESNVALKDVSNESDGLVAGVRQEQIAAQRHNQRWKSEHEPKLKTIDTNIQVLQGLERLRNLGRDKDRLENHLVKVRELEEKLKTANQNLSELDAPSSEELLQFQDSLINLRLIDAQIDTTAIRVAFRLDDVSSVVTPEPQAQQSTDGDEFLITRPTSFVIQGVGAVVVRGGGSSIEELNASALEQRSNVESILTRYSADGEQALSDLYQQRVDVQNEVLRFQDQIDDLAQEQPEEEPEAELTRVLIGIREESKVSDAAPDEWKTWGGQKIRDQSTVFEDEKGKLIDSIKEEQSHEIKANDAHLEFLKKAQEASNKVSGLKSKIGSLEQENIVVLKTYGTSEQLTGLVEESQARLKETEADLSLLNEEYEIRVELPKRLHQQGTESVKTLEKDLRKISDDLVDRKARIEEAAAQGIYSQTADLEGSVQAKQSRLGIIRARANAAKLLRDIVDAFRTQQSAALAIPVAEVVNKWLPLLTDDTYDEIDLSEQLLPIGVHSKRYDETLLFESLSFGTHEQVVVLVRLALGVLLSNNERNLVVIDDRLVNADSIRMKRLCLILEEVASNSCQIVVATCDETRYSGIPGNVIRIPFDGILAENEIAATKS